MAEESLCLLLTKYLNEFLSHTINPVANSVRKYIKSKDMILFLKLITLIKFKLYYYKYNMQPPSKNEIDILLSMCDIDLNILCLSIIDPNNIDMSIFDSKYNFYKMTMHELCVLEVRLQRKFMISYYKYMNVDMEKPYVKLLTDININSYIIYIYNNTCELTYENIAHILFYNINCLNIYIYNIYKYLSIYDEDLTKEELLQSIDGLDDIISFK